MRETGRAPGLWPQPKKDTSTGDSTAWVYVQTSRPFRYHKMIVWWGSKGATRGLSRHVYFDAWRMASAGPETSDESEGENIERKHWATMYPCEHVKMDMLNAL